MFLKQKVQVVMLERSTTKTATTFHSWEEIAKQSKTKAEKNPSLFSNDFSTRITKSEFRRPLKFKQGILCLAKPFDPTLIGFLFDSIFSVLAEGKKVVALSTSTNGAKTQMLYGRQGFTTKVRRNFLELRQYLKCVSYR